MLLSTGSFFGQSGAGSATVPAQFGPGDWSVADDATSGDITISITALPADGGSAITDLEYQIDGGSWVSVAGTTTGDYPISGLTDDVEVDVAIRAVNAIGAGTASATKAVTPTASFSPPATLHVWYDAALGSTITESGGVVSAIDDRSANALHLSQATAGSRPTLSTINSVDALIFDGTDDVLFGATSGSQADFAFTFFMVVEPQDFLAAQEAFSFANNSSTGSEQSFGVTTTPNWRVTRRGSGGSSARPVAGTPTAAPHIFRATCPGTTVTMAVDGAVIVSGAGLNVNTVTWNRISLGGYFTTSLVNPYKGKIGEVLYFTSVLSGPDIAAVEAYLADKWGITI